MQKKNLFAWIQMQKIEHKIKTGLTKKTGF